MGRGVTPMDRLDDLEAQSVFIFREAYARLRKIALLWSLGKDSNVMIWLARKAFFGRVPFPVMHVDTGKKFPEMYAFREQYAEQWNLDHSAVSEPKRKALPLARRRRHHVARRIERGHHRRDRRGGRSHKGPRAVRPRHGS